MTATGSRPEPSSRTLPEVAPVVEALPGLARVAGYAALPGPPWLAPSPAALFTVYLLTHLGVTNVQVTRQRHRHLALLEMLTSPHPTRARTRVIDDAVPMAYCLPNGPRSVPVLSQGLLDRLDADELVAVIAPERAHVEQRADLCHGSRSRRAPRSRSPLSWRCSPTTTPVERCATRCWPGRSCRSGPAACRERISPSRDRCG